MKNMLNNIEDRIIEKIKAEKIKPLSLLFFSLKKALSWFLVFIVLLFSSLSFSVLLLIIRYGDWDIYRLLGSNPFSFFLLAFPYFWLIFFVFLFVFAFKRTKKIEGIYRYSLLYYGLLAIIFVVIFSLFFSFSGLNRKLETYLADNSLVYRQLNYLRSVWDNPEKGLIAGTLSFKNNNYYLKDLNEKEWELSLSANFLGDNLLKEGAKVKVLGKQLGFALFSVKELRSWECACPHCAKLIDENCNSCAKSSCSTADSCYLKD